MAVFRIEKTRDYTVMSNHHLKNKNLTLKAKGLLSVMLSLPETWDYTLKGLAIINREGVDAIRERCGSWRRRDTSSAHGCATLRGGSPARSTSSTSSHRHRRLTSRNSLYRISQHRKSLYWKIQYWITLRWRILRGKTLYWENLRWKIQRN